MRKTIGQIVAARFRKQYFCNRKWLEFDQWYLQPEQMYTILLELRSKEAVDTLLGTSSWTRRLPKDCVKPGRAV